MDWTFADADPRMSGRLRTLISQESGDPVIAVIALSGVGKPKTKTSRGSAHFFKRFNQQSNGEQGPRASSVRKRPGFETGLSYDWCREGYESELAGLLAGKVVAGRTI